MRQSDARRVECRDKAKRCLTVANAATCTDDDACTGDKAYGGGTGSGPTQQAEIRTAATVPPTSHPATDDRPRGLSLRQLVEHSGVSMRTIRINVQHKLTASPGRRVAVPKRSIRCTTSNRVHLIRRWQGLGRTLSAIGEGLPRMSDAEVAVALKESSSTPKQRRQRHEPTTWNYFELADGVELRVRRPASTESNRPADPVLAAREGVLRRAAGYPRRRKTRFGRAGHKPGFPV
jgi:hypothetical protein